MLHILNFLLAGVGGQGTILASDVLVNVGLAAGYQAKQAEVHGMSQRGGSVTSFVRWGRTVYSPLVGAGEVDVYLAFEVAEALRNLGQLRPGALTVVNLQAIKPITVTSGGQAYPDDDRLRAKIAEVTDKAVYVDGEQIAGALGNVKAANVVLLGALSALIERSGLAPELTPDDWLKVIVERVPAKYVELNRQAFRAGREAVGEEQRLNRELNVLADLNRIREKTARAYGVYPGDPIAEARAESETETMQKKIRKRQLPYSQGELS